MEHSIIVIKLEKKFLDLDKKKIFNNKNDNSSKINDKAIENIRKPMLILIIYMKY